MIKIVGYNILRKIASGGMGDVYLAKHKQLDKNVAIKSLHEHLVDDNNFRERFVQEAKIHSQLDHPNIVKLIDYREEDDGLFLIMEYIAGKQINEFIRTETGPISEQFLQPIFIQILDAINYAHKKGLIHRDIKPSNIMISGSLKDARVKVLDFGVAKLQDEEKGLTKSGVQIGTTSYMSPEQVNAKKVDKLTDIYSLGVTLFFMATGVGPYQKDTNSFNIQLKIVKEPLPKASEIYPGVSKKIDTIISKATEKEKKDRFQSCVDFKKAFETNVHLKTNISTSSSESNNKGCFITLFVMFILCLIISVCVLLTRNNKAWSEREFEIAMEDCRNNPLSKYECECMISKIEKRYSFEEFDRMINGKGGPFLDSEDHIELRRFQNFIEEAYKDCSDILDDEYRYY